MCIWFACMKFLYIGLGFLSLGLGVVGVFLPGLPTTPFLFGTLFFFAKSSPRLHSWFLGTTIYRKHLKTFNEQRALTKKSKTYILIIATSLLVLSFYAMPNIYGKIAIGILLLVKYWFFFFRVKTIES